MNKLGLPRPVVVDDELEVLDAADAADGVVAIGVRLGDKLFTCTVFLLERSLQVHARTLSPALRVPVSAHSAGLSGLGNGISSGQEYAGF